MLAEILQSLGVPPQHPGAAAGNWLDSPSGPAIESLNPTTAQPLAAVSSASAEDYEQIAQSAHEAFLKWRLVPAPRRGELVRHVGHSLRAHKTNLARLITLEVGKIHSEAAGEVQEMIDMCDFAVGLSRQLHGLTIASERPAHRLLELWQPLGPVGVITAFNFPVAVWAWNAMLAAICGNPVIWKPSPFAPLCSLAVHAIAQQVAAEADAPPIFHLANGDTSMGERICRDQRLPLISATGSCQMGRRVGTLVAERFGRSLLELGGNNAAIVTPRANLELAMRAILFAAVGTTGQRCTTLRRLIVHESLIDLLTERLQRAYRSLPIGDPADPHTLIGPLISQTAVDAMQHALKTAVEQGAQVLQGGKPLDRPGFFVEPALVRARPSMPIVAEETFAPILYLLPYRELEEAIAMQNNVAQGLSSALFTDSLLEAEQFLGPAGSDCGIANINLGTSGAEIGGAFGGEKSTGGGREAGSDSWKTYMRRQTCTINGSFQLPLAQGVRFEPIT